MRLAWLNVSRPGHVEGSSGGSGATSGVGFGAATYRRLLC